MAGLAGRGAPVDQAEVRSPRRVARPQRLPSARAITGGLLMALAALGVVLTLEGAGAGASEQVVVAAEDIQPGERIEEDHLRLEAAKLPTSASEHAFDDVSSLVGRVALGPITEGEIVQGGSVTEERSATPAHEVALTLPRAQIAVGRLRQGERVDVYGTDDVRTWSVVRGARVVQIELEDDGSLTSDRELSVVISVPSAPHVAAVVDALRRADVTVVRSTFADPRDVEPVEHDRDAASGPTGDDASPAPSATEP